MVRVLVDEETDLPRGIGEVIVSYVANAELAPPSDGEVTVRVSSARPRLKTPAAPTPEPASAPSSAAGTVRVPEAAEEPSGSGVGLWLRWPGGEARVAPGTRAQVGRPHDSPPSGFVALTGASTRINSAQFHIEGSTQGVVVSRPIRSNPVKVAGRLLQPGGRMVVAELPVEVDLSNGELTVTVETA